ncbi:ABC transporter permease [Thermosediminibacter litoriperuensis]|uniref:Ribose transport system permease protein n=1 Tax=Thermosediminibacter litoriperuensis TaxID=291989 RepID=A0A5S5APU5_9FIRM|nr:ABC transporter permease [Thermosediminibacter litoriperuensis]TYP53340.1 ribose transport system permease protein [Thermosediminibacter litoriperuensis]
MDKSQGQILLRENDKIINEFKKLTSVEYLQKYGILLALFLMCAILSIISPHFLKIGNIINILLQSSINAILAFGLTFVIITSGIDLSVGSILALGGVTMGIVLQNLSNVFFAILLGLLVSSLCGLTNGLLITRLDLPPFIVTLGMMSIARGFALIITKGYPISGLPPMVRFLGAGKILGIPVPVIIGGGIYIITHIILSQTKLGRYAYAIGGNEEATKLSGVDVNKYKIIIYTISGIFAGISGIVLAVFCKRKFPIFAKIFPQAPVGNFYVNLIAS